MDEMDLLHRKEKKSTGDMSQSFTRERWLVYGGRGWVGTQLCADLAAHVDVIHGESRAHHRDTVRAELARHRPHVLLSLVGRTRGPNWPNIDYLEDKPDVNVRDNLHAPLTLAQEAQRAGVYMIYLGTGCIYSSTPNNPQSEFHVPNFQGSQYSLVKGVTDQLMGGFDHVLNLRIRMPVSATPGPFNFVSKLLGYERVIDVPNSLSVLPSLFPALRSLARRRITGTLNFTNPGYLSHSQVLELYRTHVDPTVEWSTFTEAEQNRLLKAKRSNNVLDTGKLRRFCPDVPGVREALVAVLQTWRPRRHVPRTVCVTGGCGFIGSALVRQLLAASHVERVVVVDKMTYAANRKNLPATHEKLSLHRVDVANLAAVRGVFARYTFDTVLHCAAETHVDRSFDSSADFVRTNIGGTHALLQVAKDHPSLERFVHVSTDEVYGDCLGPEAKGEGARLDPTNPYAATKSGAEHIVRSYYHSFELPIVVIRCNNVFGPRQYPEKLVPKFLWQCRRGSPMTLHGAGQSRRAFIYIADVVRAFEQVVALGQVGETYNVGVSTELTVREVASELQRVFPDARVTHVRDREYNDQRYFIDGRKLRLLGWRPRVTFAEGLDRVAAWVAAHPDHWPSEVVERCVVEFTSPDPEQKGDRDGGVKNAVGELKK